MPVTEAVKTGDWMVTYFENNNTVDIGVPFLKFNSTNKLVATLDGNIYNGTWFEANTGGNNTIELNITTTNTKLLKANRTWSVVRITEYNVYLKDANTASNATIQLMKH